MTTFIFVATPVIANPVEITISGEYTEDDTDTPEVDERFVLKLTYSVVPDPIPKAVDLRFGTDLGTDFPYDSIGHIVPTTALV